jgi:hypothetical protein
MLDDHAGVAQHRALLGIAQALDLLDQVGKASKLRSRKRPVWTSVQT